MGWFMANKKIVSAKSTVVLLLLFIVAVSIALSGCVQKQAETALPVAEEILRVEEQPAVEIVPPETSLITEVEENVPEEAHDPDADESLQDDDTANQVTWYHDTEWKPDGNPPACPEPFVLQTPVDINLATSILYPGQVRGGNYKAHGGFRFDRSNNNDITVKAPLDGMLVRGSRYIEGEEIQYMFDIINPCGIMVRFDHLLTLSPKFAEAAEQLRPATVDDSRTTDISPIQIKTGDVIAMAVGLKKTGNVGVDFGVYDLRQKNKAAQNPAWLREHGGEQAAYALCWLDLLPAADSTKAKSLPGGDSSNGKKSDYCR